MHPSRTQPGRRASRAAAPPTPPSPCRDAGHAAPGPSDALSGPPKAPASHPCGSCPYRRDVPSGLWHREEYTKLPRYDAETFAQPTGIFLCHQADGRVCAGWAGCHDTYELLALRLAQNVWGMTDADLQATLDYESPVPLFASGAEAAEHGMAEVDDPGPAARRAIDRLAAKLDRRGTA